MSGSPTIHLHIGHGKVASSTIQNLLQSNAGEIRRQGLLIADVNFEFPRTGPVRGYPMQILKQWIADPETRQKTLSEALDRTIEACRSGKARGAIVSSEMLCAPKAAEWFRASADGIRIHAILYLRRQDRWLESAWKQWALKDGRSLNDFVESSIQSGNPQFLRSAQAWRKTADQLTVRPIEGVEDVQADFAHWCGLDFSQLEPVEPANRTFDWALLDLFSRNSFLFEDMNDNRVFDFLNLILPDDAPREGHGLLTSDQAARVWSTFKEENLELRREFFPDLPTCDWDRPPDPDRESGRMNDFGSAESVYRNLAIQLFVAMNLYHRIRSGGPKAKAIGEQLDALESRTDRIGDSVARRFDRLRSRLEREEARRQALEKRLARLESHSPWRWLSKAGARLKAWPKRPTRIESQKDETPTEDS